MLGIDERTFGFARVRKAYYDTRDDDAERTVALIRRIERYDQDLRALKLDDHELDRDLRLVSPTLAPILLLRVVLVFLLLPPVLFVGCIVNVPTGIFLALFARAVSRLRKDEATVKMLVGAIVFPLTWIGAGIAAAVAHAPLHEAFPTVPDQAVVAGIGVAVLSAVGGMVALRYRRFARDTLRAVRVRFTHLTRRRSIERLLAERGRHPRRSLVDRRGPRPPRRGHGGRHDPLVGLKTRLARAARPNSPHLLGAPVETAYAEGCAARNFSATGRSRSETRSDFAGSKAQEPATRRA